jgi:hypothetical protein
VVERKWGALAGLQCIVLCIGGNDAAKRRGGVQVRVCMHDYVIACEHVSDCVWVIAYMSACMNA